MNKTSRRGFLKTVGIAAAAPATVPGSVLADAERQEGATPHLLCAQQRPKEIVGESLSFAGYLQCLPWCVMEVEAC